MPVPFVAIFWALWQQNFSSWIVQAESMDRHLFGIEWLSSQIQTVNPIFILIMLPVFSYWLYPLVGEIRSLDATAKNRRRIIRYRGVVSDRRLDSDANRRRRSTEHHLAGLGLRRSDGSARRWSRPRTSSFPTPRGR